MGYRLTIDQDLCTSSHLCTRVAPILFRIADDGRTEVIDEHPGADLQFVAEEAFQRCPAQAIGMERTKD